METQILVLFTGRKLTFLSTKPLSQNKALFLSTNFLSLGNLVLNCAKAMKAMSVKSFKLNFPPIFLLLS